MTVKRQVTRHILDIAKSVDLRPTEENLSPLQLDTLLFIQRKGCVKATDLAKEFKVTPATVTIQIDRLAKKGWVKRCYDTNDRRVVNITLTEQADSQLEDIIEKLMKRYDWIFEPFSKKEMETLLKMLERVKENAPKNQ